MKVFTGLPGVGKTKAIIEAMRGHDSRGAPVKLFLSSEHPELTRRKNVRPGGLMGCRAPGYSYPIDHVVTTGKAIEILNELQLGTMAAFDEAQFFSKEIVDAWHGATRRGIEIWVGTPSLEQLSRLKQLGYTVEELTVKCICGGNTATRVMYVENLAIPMHLCDECYFTRRKELLDELLSEVQAGKPFPGEKKTYQPFFEIDMPGWEFVRHDSKARFNLALDAMARCTSLYDGSEVRRLDLTYLDLGSCSGFFCDAMSSIGVTSTGVDVSRELIDWSRRMALIKERKIDFICEDALDFTRRCQDVFDVTSTFATIQWVMTQKGYEAGVECFKNLFALTRTMCIVEMGYTLEEIYKSRIPDRPSEIDREWVMDIMQEHGDFKAIEVFPAGQDGIWRDIFVGFKEEPTNRPFLVEFDAGPVQQISAPSYAWPDSWVGVNFEVFFKAHERITTGYIEGWIPEQESGIPSCISIAVNGEEVCEAEVAGGTFRVDFPCERKKGRMFWIGADAPQANINSKDDERLLTFVLTGMGFK